LALFDAFVARMTLAQFTEPKLLVPRLLSEQRDAAITELSQRLENAGRIESSAAFSQAVLEHEWLASAVFDSVAFPLARSRAVKELSFAVGLSQPGVRWGTPRAPLVHTIVLCAVPLSEGQSYLSLVLTFSSFIKDETVFTALKRATQPEEMLAVLDTVRMVRMTALPGQPSHA